MIRIFADSGRVEVWTGKGRGPCPIASMTLDEAGNAELIAKELGKNIIVELVVNHGREIKKFQPK